MRSFYFESERPGPPVWSFPVFFRSGLGLGSVSRPDLQTLDFLHVLKLPADGKGFVVWKERLELSIKARGLYGPLDGTTVRPMMPPLPPPDNPPRPQAQAKDTSTVAAQTPLTSAEVSATERYVKDISQYLQEQVIVFSASRSS